MNFAEIKNHIITLAEKYHITSDDWFYQTIINHKGIIPMLEQLQSICGPMEYVLDCERDIFDPNNQQTVVLFTDHDVMIGLDAGYAGYSSWDHGYADSFQYLYQCNKKEVMSVVYEKVKEIK